MPISINGTGSITGISAGGLPDGVITTDDIASNAVTFGKIGTTEQGQLCKAWVNFNGTGAVAIRAAYNVSSIADNGTGDYTVNFTTALADANYSCTVGAGTDSGSSVSGSWAHSVGFARTSSSIRFRTSRPDTGALTDASDSNVAVFR